MLDPSLIRAAASFVAYVLIVAGPSLFAQAPDRSKPPSPGPIPSLKLPPIQHLKLSNDLQVILMEKHNVPLVQMELVAQTGSAMDPPALPGLADMTASMLEEGAGSRTALQLADAIDFLGANISPYAGQHTLGVVMHASLSKVDSALALFADMVLRPTFPTEELERNRKERLTTLTQWRDDPPQISRVLFNQTLFGPDHPYGRITIGNEKSLRSMSVDDLRKFHRKYVRPNNSALIVVGDVTAKEILPRLEDAFGKWEKGEADQQPFPAAEQVKERTVYLVDKPGAPQSVITVGRIGARRATEDYFPLVVMNTILGGSFRSRLNQNLRETHGYTYGAFSGFDFLMNPGAFRAAASVQTAVTDKALTEFMKEIKGILEPVSDEELSRAENYLTLKYPGNFQSVAQVADQLVDLFLYRLGDQYFDEYNSRVRAVTKEDVQRVARRYLDPEKMAIVVVGDRKQVEQGIAGLSLGTIRNLTIEDVLGPAPAPEGGR